MWKRTWRREVPPLCRSNEKILAMNTPPDPRTKRPDFLIEIYKQMMVDINRHIVVVWQSIGVVVGSFATLSLVEKKVLPLDIAASLLVFICAGSLAMILDSSYWYNRNLCIIANIERLFLDSTDLRHVHYYFGRHRPENRMITTLKIQVWFSGGAGLLVLIYHFWVQIFPGSGSALSQSYLPKAFPYIAAVFAALLLWRLKRKLDKHYEEFLRESPGIEISTEGIVYGGGHGFKEEGRVS